MGIDNQKFDAIIVGSGPGGGTVAKELSLRGKKVLILERGPDRPVRGTFMQFAAQLLVPWKSFLMEYRNVLGMVRGITIGGSTQFYYGTCYPIPHDMLKKHGIDLKKEEKEARKEIPVAVLKKEMITPMAERIMESARDLGYDWNPLEKFMYQDRWKPGTPFGYYGDPHRVRWGARMSVEEACESGAVLVDKAKVSRVIMEGKKAVGVVYRRKGKQHRAFAHVTVLAAGGIGTPVILRKTGLKKVGYDFFYDPLITVSGRIKDLEKRKDEIPMTAGCRFPEEGVIMTDMAMPTMLDKIFTAEVFRFHRLFESRKTIRIMIKIRDDLGGRLTDSGGIRKMLTANDREKLNTGFARAKEILKNAGATGIFKTWYLAAHPGGTVKLGESVDSDLRVMEYENLYACDCSVIPEPWGLPPTMTIVCLAKRLAKHLTEQEKKKKK